jgi:hypothetical protein
METTVTKTKVTKPRNYDNKLAHSLAGDIHFGDDYKWLAREHGISPARVCALVMWWLFKDDPDATASEIREARRECGFPAIKRLRK